jgi:glutathione S-transferase
MMTLVAFPWSPFCLVQQRLLEYVGKPFKTITIPNTDRSLVWRLTRQRYYQVPIIKDGHTVVFETSDDSQVIAKYLDTKYGLDLFPREWAGLQNLLWHIIENDIEGACFKLNDIYYQEYLPRKEWLAFIRHKERRFGRGCLDQWREGQKELLAQLTLRLAPFEQMLATRPHLLDDQLRFVDFDLYGMLANFLYTGHYQLPAEHPRLREWFQRMKQVTRVV